MVRDENNITQAKYSRFGRLRQVLDVGRGDAGRRAGSLLQGGGVASSLASARDARQASGEDVPAAHNLNHGGVVVTKDARRMADAKEKK